MMSLAACVTGFFLDRLFGDPVWLYHPVRMIGNMISFLEKRLRKENDKKKGSKAKNSAKNSASQRIILALKAKLPLRKYGVECGTEGGAEYPSVDLLFLRVVLVLSDLCGKISE